VFTKRRCPVVQETHDFVAFLSDGFEVDGIQQTDQDKKQQNH